MQSITVSKSHLKSHLLEYLRQVELGKKPLVVTHLGKSVIKISPYVENSDEILTSLRKSVISYEKPTEPVGEDEWKQLT